MLHYLSKAPLALRDDHAIYLGILKALSEFAAFTPGVPFSFRSTEGSFDEITREILPLGRYLRSNRELISLFSRWAELRLSNFLGRLAQEVNVEGYKFHNAEYFRLYIRLRVLRDKSGYSLAPHQDSKDTLFAFLLQLDQKNANTSIFLKDRVIEKTDRSSLDLQDYMSAHQFFERFFEKLNIDCSAFRLEPNAFGGVSKYVAWHQNGNVYFSQSVGDEVFVTRFDELRLSVPFGSLLAFHNPLADFAFESSYTRYVRENCRHGFFPTEFVNRPVLLMDLLCAYTNHDTCLPLIEDQNDNDNEFYLFFRKSTSEKMMRNCGFF